MGETDFHRDLMIDLIKALEIHFQPRTDVYVSGNILMLYEEDEPNSHVSPDVLIALDIPRHPRENYKVWEEGKAPDLVIEVTSKTTRLRDTGVKKGLYEALGVNEYILFDPRNEYLKPRFQVYRLDGELYVRALVSESTGYRSEATGLEFRVVEGQLRVLDLATGRLLLSPSEQAARAEQEAARAQLLEQELAALKKRLAELEP